MESAADKVKEVRESISNKLSGLADTIRENYMVIIGVVCVIIVMYIIYTYGGAHFTASKGILGDKLSDIESEMKEWIAKINARQNANLK